MFIISLKYVKPLSEVDRFLAEHMKFITRYYQAGNFLLSGRKEPREGGIIIANAPNRSDVEKIVQQDPFYRENIAEYQITEFFPTTTSDALSFLKETL